IGLYQLEFETALFFKGTPLPDPLPLQGRGRNDEREWCNCNLEMVLPSFQLPRRKTDARAFYLPQREALRPGRRSSDTGRAGRSFSAGEFLRAWCMSATEAGPIPLGQQAQNNQRHLADNKKHEPFERCIHETVRMQPDAEHVHAEP